MVSVIIPTYGNPIYLSNSIQSVLNQTYSDLELLIVDDNDPNTRDRVETEKVVTSFSDSRIKYIQHPYNKNGATARNTALKVSQGEYISFLDSDDEYLPNRLELCIKTLENAVKKNSKFAGVYTGCEFRKSGKTYNRYKGVEEGNFLVETLACRFMFCTGSNLFITHKAASELGGFDEKFLRHQDYEFLVRFFQKYSLAAIDEILVIKNNENFNLPNVDKMIAIKKQYLEKYSFIIAGLPYDKKNYIYHSNYISLAEQCQHQGKIKRANEFYNKANEYGNLTRSEWKRRLLLPFLKYVRR